jgi:SAM-dependent methyltransferase
MTWAPDDLENVACDLCGGNKTDPIVIRPDGMHVVRCRDCALVFLSPRPKAPLIPRLYQRDYFFKDGAANACGYTDYVGEDNRLGMRVQSQQRLDAIADMTRPLPHRCLEVGCATGEFCQTLLEQGAVPTGIDLSDFAIKEARSRYPGIDFRNGDIESVEFDGQFDAIFAFELIEHVLSPRRFFQAARRLLRPGGLLVFSTPNVNCAQDVGPSRWLGYVSSFEHLYFLSPETMSEYCRQTGFMVTQWMTAGGGLPPKPQPVRGLVRNTLRRTGLLSLARTARNAFRDAVSTGKHAYQPGGRYHNLLFACKKADTP